jgi:hypothetical protein
VAEIPSASSSSEKTLRPSSSTSERCRWHDDPVVSANGRAMNVTAIPALADRVRIASLKSRCRSAISSAWRYSRLISHWPRPHSTWLVHGPSSDAASASRTPEKKPSYRSPAWIV